MKTKTKYVLKRWEIEEFQARMSKLEQTMQHLKERSIEVEIAIYSRGNETAVTMNDKNWHKIVCQYDGDRCLGGPTIHWTSRWDVKTDGFHLKSMQLDDYTAEKRYKGWYGQYNKENDFKYDQIPRDVLLIHHNALLEHIKSMGVWYPCHIFNDFTGELYRP